MRDMALLAILATLTVWSLKQPWIGAMAWAWVSLMSPHTQFGYSAAGWPVATGIAACTLVGLVAARDKQNPFVGGAVWCLLAFMIWISVTLPFSIYFDASYGLWERSLKIFFMIFVTLALITDRRKLNVFIWVNVLSLAYYGVKGGLFTIATGGNYRVWGPGGFIEGNNEVALAVITVIPLMRYLQLQLTNRYARAGMTFMMAMSAVMALGTHSRGALLGLGAMGLYFWLKSENKVRWGIAIVVAGTLALSLMPAEWWNRMDTIKTYDSDASAMGRINAWWMAFNLAKDRFFGGGFMIWMGPVFEKYAPIPDDVHAAHSIFFQVLGEHGFVGLFLFLSIGVATWISARRLATIGRSESAQRWAAELGAMVQVSMIGYGITGAFLSLAYYDLPYNVMIMAVLGLKFARAEQAALRPAAPVQSVYLNPRPTVATSPK